MKLILDYYKADETKVKQSVESGSSVIETEYVGPLVYEVVGSTRSLKYIITPEGLAYNNNNTYLYEYHIKDHLGNVRVVLAQDGVIKQTTDYYPYGMKRAKPAPTSRGFGHEPRPPMIICEFHESQLKIKVLDE